MKSRMIGALALAWHVCWAEASAARVLDARRHHLGVAGQPEWTEFAGSTPAGPQLELTFTAAANAREATLFIAQREVKVAWQVAVNGRRVGTLETLSQPLVRALSVPAGTLRDGDNTLTIARAAARLADDIEIGGIELEERPRAEVLGEAGIDVVVTASDGGVLPCRITVVDEQDALMPLQAREGQALAVRTGVAYTADGKAKLGLRAGTYLVIASRGFEYGTARARVTLAAGEVKPVALTLGREVPTPGLVACDTHIHTLTHSRHGDATVEERMLTIAGEGIEFAVATDHNHHADHTEASARMGTSAHFRPVIGNEVTTKAGHFNAFPIAASGEVPNAQLTDWGELLRHVRSVTGAKVITLNHPRDVHSAFTPLAPENFNAASGALKAGETLELDAIEVVTSAAMQSDPMQLFRDWFALLNYGYKVAGVGASDTHHVSEFILGQARTYAVAADTEPAAIRVDEVCESYRRGRVLVSFGLLANVTVDGKFRVGDVATALGDTVRLEVTVLGPAWVKADRVELLANGIKVREQAIPPTDAVEKARLTWTLPRPRHDVHWVVVATGPGVTGPFWEVPRPYQPTSKHFVPRLIGATNPVWIDGDGDGTFTPARGLARGVVERTAGNMGKLIEALRGYDEAVAVQARDLMARRVQGR